MLKNFIDYQKLIMQEFIIVYALSCYYRRNQTIMRLKEIRVEREMTQKEVADYIGVTCQTLSNWERNVTEPDITTLLNLANLYRVTLDYLLGREYNETSISIDEFKKIETSTFIEAIKSILVK